MGGEVAARAAGSVDLLDALETAQGGFVFTPDQAGAYGIKELHVLEDVLRRRTRRPCPRSPSASARRSAGGRAGRTGYLFLSAYYAALRGRLETRLLFGHRRKDKFDKA